ncbi:MAG: ATP-binding protein [Fluviicoccus sp.]|uniref:hybrid sensor histidine kinase/response regulator n=1 Tax=Fluviicoccus sp. TaxID=2003552 RepID=UPI00271CD1F1|nr:PAS domain-containing hybrid sensor histidine kinase/response regulator [Fluviicoccus sp.]MDO8331395.1 ATP-binding protein [Fluviicoccus sp.]
MTDLNLKQEEPPAGNDPALALRVQAEARLLEKEALLIVSSEQLSPEAMRKALYTLQVHQIELEMQNEELRHTQLLLDAARSRYFDLYDLAPVGYCTVSGEGRIVEANIAAAALMGETRADLAGERFSRFIDKSHQDIYYLYRKQFFAPGEPHACELRLNRRHGGHAWVHLVTVAAGDNAEDGEQHMVLHDITERMRLDDLLKSKNTELQNARLLADKANLAKSDFLSSMSHELRTPLSAILGFTQLLESGSPEPTANQRRNLDQILKAGWYLLELVNEILDLALIESGKLSMSLEPLSLAEVMQECRAMVEPMAQQRGIRLTFPRFNLPFYVRADRTRLKQVLVNLLSNAIKYNTPEGSVVVSCAAGAEGHIFVCVRDTGLGLAPEKLEQLFQPFNRLGQEGGAEEGTGIGLVVSKRLMELMGGRIGVESDVGQGSEFRIELMLTDVPRAIAPAAQAPAAVEVTARSAAQLTMLYVEDNPANRLLVEEIMTRRPHIRLLSAVDGQGGMDMARIHRPDVILMDINLPGINGYQARRLLATDPLTRHIPVLALSANAMRHDIEKGLEAGFFRYLTKPIKVAEFLEALDVAFEVAYADRLAFEEKNL